jgi:hypothetical protein
VVKIAATATTKCLASFFVGSFGSWHLILRFPSLMPHYMKAAAAIIKKNESEV